MGGCTSQRRVFYIMSSGRVYVIIMCLLHSAGREGVRLNEVSFTEWGTGGVFYIVGDRRVYVSMTGRSHLLYSGSIEDRSFHALP